MKTYRVSFARAADLLDVPVVREWHKRRRRKSAPLSKTIADADASEQDEIKF